MSNTKTGVIQSFSMYKFILLCGYVLSSYGQGTRYNPGGLMLPTIPPPPEPKTKSLFHIDESLMQPNKFKTRRGKGTQGVGIRVGVDSMHGFPVIRHEHSEPKPKTLIPEFHFGGAKKDIVPLLSFMDAQIMKEIFPNGFADIKSKIRKSDTSSYAKSIDQMFNIHLEAGSKQSTRKEIRQFKDRQTLNTDARSNKMTDRRSDTAQAVHFGFPIDLSNKGKKEVFPNEDTFKLNGHIPHSNTLFEKINGFHDSPPGMSVGNSNPNKEDSDLLRKIQCRTKPHYNAYNELEEASYEERLNGFWQVRMCAPGSGYNQSQCGCTNVLSVSHEQPDTSVGCRPDVAIKFHGPVLDSSGNNFTIDAHDVTVRNGGAIFNGSNHLFIWRYKGYDYRDMLQIAFKFKPSMSRSLESYTLVSNCEGEGEPSFGIIFNSVSNKTLFFLQTDTQENKHSLVFNGYTDVWNDVYFRYNNGTMLGRVNNQVRSKRVLGNIQIRPDAMVFAECKKYGNYRGQLKDITIYTKCLPSLDWKVESYFNTR